MSIRHPHLILSILALALLCAGCATSTAVDRAAQSRDQSPRYDADSKRKSPPPNFAGRVVAVEDGDTIVVLDDANGMYKIRLQGIDAPEGGQAFGDRSGQSLSEMVSGKQVEIEWSKRDRYRRLVGKVLSDGSDICLQQIRAGMAWHYKHYQNEQSVEDRELYANAENEARTERLGLWSDEKPVPPWRFRRGY
jgi:endonuclease YncB( thermonuclease family)